MKEAKHTDVSPVGEQEEESEKDYRDIFNTWPLTLEERKTLHMYYDKFEVKVTPQANRITYVSFCLLTRGG